MVNTVDDTCKLAVEKLAEEVDCYFSIPVWWKELFFLMIHCYGDAKCHIKTDLCHFQGN